MILSAMITAIQVELNDDGTIHSTPEITRAVEKSVSIMSRLLPKRDMIEATITREITGETLTISTSAGTLTYKPVKIGSLTITGKTLDTDYTVNYLTGAIAEIGSNLPDTDYTVAYSLDPQMLDISSLLSDYIKIERLEYPVGESPTANPTFDVIGDYILLRGSSVNFTGEKHARIIYLKRWTVPGASAGDYPTHLDDAIIIGSVGQVLTFEAERVIQLALTTTTDLITTLATMGGLTLSAHGLSAPTAPTLRNPVAPRLGQITPPTMGGVTAPTVGNIIPPAVGRTTAPTLITFNAPSVPSLPSAPTAPTVPTVSFPYVDSLLIAVAEEIKAAKVHHTTGAALANAATWGDSPADVFAKYADTVMNAGTVRINQALTIIKKQETLIDKYAKEVAAYGSEVNSYAQEMSGTIGKYREEINAQLAAVEFNRAMIIDFEAEIREELVLISKYEGEIREETTLVSNYEVAVREEFNLVSKYEMEVREELSLITLYEAEIREELMAVTKYEAQVRSYQVDAALYQSDVAAYVAKVNNLTQEGAQTTVQIQNLVEIGGRYLASGQAKINEFLIMLGVKIEMATQKALSGQLS